MQNFDDKAASDEQRMASQTNLARRKAILKGLGKTAAVAGAAAPLSSLAGARLRYVKNNANFHCSVSGAHSVLVSGSVQSIAQCSAAVPATYGPKDGTWNGADVTPAKWPGWPTDGTQARTLSKDGLFRNPAATFLSIFGGGSSSLAGNILRNTPSSDEAHWLTALLNAQKYYNGGNGTWPHSPQQVLAHYGSTAAVTALALYKDINKPAV